MFIQTEDTPNPATLKFLPGQPVLESGSANFFSPEEAKSSPLALRLFDIEGVEGIFLGADFIAVTKSEKAKWDYLKALCLSAIMEHYVSGLSVIDDRTDKNEISDNDDEIVIQIKELLTTRIRPAVAQDGGDIVFEKFEDGVLFLQMQGACSGCPSSAVTLKGGIENMMKHYVPEVKEVRAVGEMVY